MWKMWGDGFNHISLSFLFDLCRGQTDLRAWQLCLILWWVGQIAAAAVVQCDFFYIFFQIILYPDTACSNWWGKCFFSPYLSVRSIRTTFFSDGKPSSINTVLSLKSMLIVPKPTSLCTLCFLRYGHFCPLDTRWHSILGFALILRRS